MAVLEQLQPKSVFHFFEELCAIPHGSGNTKAISDYLMDFARQRGLEAYQDELNNVIIIKAATAGYEAAEPVIIQGHMDMVCEKAPECAKDMAVEGLDLAVEGDTVYAKGTTLGGDDGIAVAMALALLESEDLPHPRLEAVLTTDEEIGLLGASGIDVAPLKGRRMINLDSEAEGIFTVSCAGGNRTTCTLPIKRQSFDGTALSITVDGLAGGHSGVEIHKGLGNAAVLLGRVLAACCQEAELRLVRADGGGKDNAIPRRAEAVIVTANAEAVEAVCRRLAEEVREEYAQTDSGVRLTVEPTKTGETAMDEASTRRAVTLLCCAPNGIQVMSAEIEGLVQTSLNLGILETEAERISATFCLRSSVDSQKRMLVERLECLTQALGGTVTVQGDYAGWRYRTDSPLRELMCEVFTKQYGHPPKIEAIHAGVECGVFAGKLEGLDCVSLGPDLTEIHTCRERMHIASVQRVWALVTETLSRMK